MTQSNETQTVVGRQLGPVAPSSVAAFDFISHLARQVAWSEKTFGPGPRVEMVIDHIRKELIEIEADPADLEEWVDLIILALDGAWRAGASPQQIIDGIVAKQTKNEGRIWPDWRTADPDKAIEHDRSADGIDGMPLIQPVEVKRDDEGYWWHPGEPDFDEGEGAAWLQWIKDQGLEYTHSDLESEDDTHPAHINYFKNGDANISAWNPEPPAGEGWFTLSIHMTEDSAVWVWVRRITQSVQS